VLAQRVPELGGDQIGRGAANEISCAS
jgi:hypothetical protein